VVKAAAPREKLTIGFAPYSQLRKLQSSAAQRTFRTAARSFLLIADVWMMYPRVLSSDYLIDCSRHRNTETSHRRVQAKRHTWHTVTLTSSRYAEKWTIGPQSEGFLSVAGCSYGSGTQFAHRRGYGFQIQNRNEGALASRLRTIVELAGCDLRAVLKPITCECS